MWKPNNRMMMRVICFFSMFTISIFTSMAQPEPIEKQVMRVACNDSCWEMNYSDDGLLTSIYSNTGDERQLLWSYNYHATLEGMPYVLQESYYPVDYSAYDKGEATFYRQSKLSGDSLISEDRNENTFMWSKGEDFEYEYINGRMTRIKGENGIITIDISWNNDNLQQIDIMEKGVKVGTITCSYSNLPGKGICQALNSPLFYLLEYYMILPLGPLVHGYYGKLSNNLLAEMSISFNKFFIEEHSLNMMDTGNYPIVRHKSKTYQYETDTWGEVTKIIVSSEGTETEYVIDYGNYDSCNSLYFSTSNHSFDTIGQYFFDLQGRRLQNKTGKGVYVSKGRKVLY
jgi:hypothetical protein